MSDINTERTVGILRVELNRPTRKNALTASMYASLAEIFDDGGKDEAVRVVLWHGAGDSFRIVPVGRALRCRAGGGAGPRDPRGAGPAVVRHSNRNRAEACSKTRRRIAGQQTSH